MISVVILALNEALDMPGCLSSIEWCDDIHVVDSGSTDNTVEIAAHFGAKILTNVFQSFAQQRNWSLDNCDLRHEWILFLDADERSTNEFHASILNATSSAGSSVAGFFCCWKTMLGSKWLRRSDNFPKWQFRLLRMGCARFSDSGHGQKEGLVSGSIEYIHMPYLHYAFSKGWVCWTEKHRAYAKKDAASILEQPLSIKSFLSLHGSKRNVAIKRVVRVLPGWPLLRFAYTYILRAGFLDGREGLIYCQRMLWYERQVRRELLSMRVVPLQN
jgi:glycosyltransferase involved in cell wall biosynthesis